MLGELVDLIAAHGQSRAVQGIVDSIEDKIFRLRVQSSDLHKGDAVRAQRRVPEDARYTLNALVEVGGAPIVVVRPLGPWMRVQQREFVRFRLTATATANLRADTSRGLLSAGSLDPEIIVNSRVIDISAGGLQLECDVDMNVGERLQVTFQLPEVGAVETASMVVRRTRGARGGNRYGVKFIGLPADVETRVLRWIYDQQLRKRRHTIG